MNNLIKICKNCYFKQNKLCLNIGSYMCTEEVSDDGECEEWESKTDE